MWWLETPCVTLMWWLDSQSGVTFSCGGWIAIVCCAGWLDSHFAVTFSRGGWIAIVSSTDVVAGQPFCCVPLLWWLDGHSVKH